MNHAIMSVMLYGDWRNRHRPGAGKRGVAGQMELEDK